jgi:hypothetical protein
MIIERKVMPSEVRCKTCAFVHDEASVGALSSRFTCRRVTPGSVFVKGEVGTGDWPRVTPELDWCSEHSELNEVEECECDCEESEEALEKVQLALSLACHHIITLQKQMKERESDSGVDCASLQNAFMEAAREWTE